MSKSLLIVAPYFYPAVEFGGPVTSTLELAIAMVKRGSRVTVLTTDIRQGGRGIKTKKRDIDGVNIIYAKSLFGKLGWKIRLFISFDQIIKGIGLIKKSDIVHFQDFFVLSHFFLSIFCTIYNKKYFITPHGSFSFKQERGNVLAKKIFFYIFIKRVVDKATKIIAVSQKEKESIRQEFPTYKGKVVYIPNIVSFKKDKGENVRKRLKLGRYDKIVLFLGRIYQLKGVTDLLEGFVLYKKTNRKNIKLVFAGPDAGAVNHLKALINKKRIGKNVIFSGMVEATAKSSLIKESDVVCLTSYSEGLPTVILEASFFSKPSIVTKECNVDSLVKAKGALITTHDPTEISKKLKIFFDSEILGSEMGKNANRWFLENFSITKISDRYKQLYETEN